VRTTAATASIIRKVGAAGLAALLCGAPRVTGTTTGGPGDVRALQARGCRLLASGAERSTTFRRLLEEIASSDVVVYVTLDPYAGQYGGIQLDGLLRWAGTAAETRYVVVWVQPRQPDDELIVTLAHELHHAVEVARARDVRSQAALMRLYEGIGRSGNPGRFETEAAQKTAEQVAAELRRFR